MSTILSLVACSGLPPKLPPPSGLVIADEPLAAEAAAQVLRQGGSAGDAAAALGLSLAVTFPLAAGLGSGGVCVTGAGAKAPVEVIEFLPGTAINGGAIALPMLPRGLALLQARYGTRRWAEVVLPAEKLAGELKASRALVRRLAGEPALSATPREFADLVGGVLTDGLPVRQPALAAVLMDLREKGPESFYTGEAGERLLAASDRVGGRLTAADLPITKPRLLSAEAVLFGDVAVYFPSGSSHAANIAGHFWMAVAADPDPAKTAAHARAALDEYWAGRKLYEDLGATSFLVADNEGRVIVCGLTMNGPFGARHMPAELGFAFALSPSVDTGGLGSDLLQPMLAERNGQVIFAGVAAGGVESWGRLAELFLTMLDPAKATTARAALSVEPKGPQQGLAILACPSGIDERKCRFSATPGGSGVSVPTGSGYGRAF
ncbi:MAG: gamma-glutamyltransferase [Alphaproteobacteria bacterium]|nr:gamma-glutamyltransferase [Alphaproteobacteria bacterium]